MWLEAADDHQAKEATAAPEKADNATAEAASKVEEKAAETEESASQKKTEFVRLKRNDDKQPTALQTAITRYQRKKPGEPTLTVDLIAAVHVADGTYYDELNRRFRAYDAVLFELVAPKGIRFKPGKRESSSHPISFLQRALRDVLDLEFQLECIDYSQKNMLHADMTPEQFRQSMEDRNDGFMQMFWRLLKHSLTSQSKSSAPPINDLQLLVALLRSDRSLQLKRIMAEQVGQMEEQLAGLNGPDGSTIITERNKVALGVLKQQADLGKRRMAIFYGAGHLSDMEARLEKDFGLKRLQQDWLVAWSMADPEDATDADKSKDPASDVDGSTETVQEQ